MTRVWRWTRERMQAAHDAGLVVQTKSGGVPFLKRYLDEQKSTPVDTIWEDIRPVQPQSKERTGYPTQKPLALYERIIEASSNPGDIVCVTHSPAAPRRPSPPNAWAASGSRWTSGWAQSISCASALPTTASC